MIILCKKNKYEQFVQATENEVYIYAKFEYLDVHIFL
jgi:hypothetical protein